MSMMNITPLRPPQQHGMTLIEVLVALLIFSFAFLGLIGMQARAAQVSTDAEDRSRAALLANEIVSDMYLQKSVLLDPTKVDAWKSRVKDPATAGLPVVNDPSVVVTGAMATITIAWHPTSRPSAEPDSQYVTQVVMP
jgi:type IV pilus assembly protein PilV